MALYGLGSRSDVQDKGVFHGVVRILGLPLGHGAVQDVLGYEPQHVDGVLGGAVGRGVGQLELGEVVCRHAGPDRRREDGEALVHARPADALRSQESAVGGEASTTAQSTSKASVASICSRMRLAIHPAAAPLRSLEGGSMSGRDHGGGSAMAPEIA
ncbi:MAG: hypothetical protein ABI269_15360 [Lapillicoccus sp.]